MINDKNINSLKIGVVGSGSWGTALANLLGDKGYKVDLWAFEAEVKKSIQDYNENKMYLPDVYLSKNIFPSNDICQVVSDKDIVLVVVPSHVMRKTAEKIADFLDENTIVVSASKGIEDETYLTMSSVLKETITKICDDNVTVISGPTFAREVARNVPTVVAVASTNQDIACSVQKVFVTPFFRVYTNNDLTGVEIGGAVKNVIAIAAGVIDGLGLGLNTRTALITRGLTEIRRLGIKLGAYPRTFTGLTGVGDLILTCTGNLSRNYSLGKQLGEGRKIDEILSGMHMVAEGVNTARSVYNLSRKINVEMPVSHEVYHILFDDYSPKNAVHRLMTRDLKHELDNV